MHVLLIPLAAAMKQPKQKNHHWVSMGCPQNHPDIDIYQMPDDSELGVRCCTLGGEECTSAHSLSHITGKCHLKSFKEAKEICMNKGSGKYRLCTSEELNTCCHRSCPQKFDGSPVWIEENSKGVQKFIYFKISIKSL